MIEQREGDNLAEENTRGQGWGGCGIVTVQKKKLLAIWFNG